MDPFSVTASVLTVVQLSATIGKAAFKLYCDVKDAPQELEQLSTGVLATQARLNMLIRVCQNQLSAPGCNGNLLVPSEDLTPLRLSIQRAEGCLEEIQQFLLNIRGSRASVFPCGGCCGAKTRFPSCCNTCAKSKGA